MLSACGGLVPLPAPSRNRGSAPGPAPQAPEGLGRAGESKGEETPAPLLGRRRGSPEGRGCRGAGWVRLCGFWPLLPRRPCPAGRPSRRR
ncbi:hypothetical protein GTY69_35575 [Streptomyces sp. SID8364]|nr:hypothetical protein [Streptomyces sp. SID8364]